jgi:hypothetical protein
VDKQCNDWDQLLSEHEHQLPSLSSQRRLNWDKVFSLILTKLMFYYYLVKKCVRNGIPNELRGKVSIFLLFFFFCSTACVCFAFIYLCTIKGMDALQRCI